MCGKKVGKKYLSPNNMFGPANDLKELLILFIFLLFLVFGFEAVFL